MGKTERKSYSKIVMDANIEKFIRQLSDNPFVVFAGTGVVGSDICNSWKELLEDLNKISPLSIDIKNANPKTYPDIAQKIYDHLNTKSEIDKYYSTIKNSLNPTIASCSQPQREIFCTAKHVVTTNFDVTFNHALEAENEDKSEQFSVQSLPILETKIFYDNFYSLTYLHGRDNENAIIFKRDDYKQFYPSQYEDCNGGSKTLEDFYKNLYKEKIIVFVGFSFSDEHVLEAFQRINSDIMNDDKFNSNFNPNCPPKLDQIKHYALIKKDDPSIENIDELVKILASINIEILL